MSAVLRLSKKVRSSASVYSCLRTSLLKWLRILVSWMYCVGVSDPTYDSPSSSVSVLAEAVAPPPSPDEAAEAAAAAAAAAWRSLRAVMSSWNLSTRLSTVPFQPCSCLISVSLRACWIGPGTFSRSRWVGFTPGRHTQTAALTAGVP